MDNYDISIRTEGSLRLLEPKNINVEEISNFATLLKVLSGRLFFVCSRNYRNSRLSSISASVSTLEDNCAIEVDNYLLMLSLYFIKHKLSSHPIESDFLWKLNRKYTGNEISRHHELQLKKVLLQDTQKKVLNLSYKLFEILSKERKQFTQFIQVNKTCWRIQHDVNNEISEIMKSSIEKEASRTVQKTNEKTLRRVKRFGEILQRLLSLFPVDYINSEDMRNILNRLMTVNSCVQKNKEHTLRWVKRFGEILP